MLPSITVVVLNYNSLNHLAPNLDSLLELDYPDDKLEIILVDNGSADGSVAFVQESYPQVRIVRNEGNLGFAGGNNAGATAARGEWLAILNPDTRVQPTWLRELVRPTLNDPSVAAVASKMLNWEGTALDFGGAAMNFMSWGNQPGIGDNRLARYDEPGPVLFPCGGAMLVRRDLFLKSGGFDPDYFAYFEDVDLGWRLWLLGHTVQYAPRAVVYHRHHGNWEDVAHAQRWLLAERNTLYTVCKNYDEHNLARILPATLLLALQRAYLDVNADPAQFDLPRLPQLTTWRYYVHQFCQLLRGGQVRELGQRSVAELQRRLARSNEPPPVTLPGGWQLAADDGGFKAPAIALSRLLAGRDVRENWERLMTRRQALQARRRRSDREIFPHFRWALVSNFGDARYIYAMSHVIGKFDLTAIFKYGRDLPADDPSIVALSRQVSLGLLALMDRAFALSGASEELFRLGSNRPEANYTVAREAVSILVHTNHWLWTLPDGDLLTVLNYLHTKLVMLENSMEKSDE